jgi:hypothetical protein
VIDVDASVDPYRLSLQTVQPSLVADRAQVLNKAGKYLMRVRLAQIDESDTLWSSVNAGNHSLNIDLLAGVLNRLGRFDGIGRKN